MSQEKLDNKMIDKTIDQREKILADAEAKAEKLLKNAETERKRIMDMSNKSIEGIIGSELRAVHDRIVGRAQLEGRRKVLESRMVVLEKVYNDAKAEIKKIAEGKNKDYDYEEMLVKMIVEADEGMGDDEYIVEANKKDLKYLKKSLDEISEKIGGKKLILSDTPAEIIGGVIVSNTSGTKSMENTLETRLELSNQKLQSEIAEKLGII